MRVTLNGNTYSDDGTAERDMLHGGSRDWFFPLISDFLGDAGKALLTYSSTQHTVSTGSKTFVLDEERPFGIGSYVMVVDQADATNWLTGQVTAYTHPDMTIEVELTNGSPTYDPDQWMIQVSANTKANTDAAQRAEDAADAAEISASEADTSATNAANSETNAAASETDADEHKTTAQRYASEAEGTTVVDADTGTDTGTYSSLHHRNKSEAAQTAAETAETNAAASEVNADEHKVTAQRYASESEGVTVVDADSGTDTGTYSSLHHRNKSEAAQSAAETAESNAATSESNASDSETTAERWATETEGTTVVDASDSTDTGKYSALHHASKADTSASNAATSESNAAASETDADEHKTTAKRYASETEDTTVVDADTGTDTGTYSSLHHRNKAEAAQSAAETAESNAATSETNAANSADSAATSETNASDSASAASASETDAGEHETTAHRWANEVEGTTVIDADTGSDTGEYSAYHWAKKAEAATTEPMMYKGSWDASTGSYPSSPDKGELYKVGVEGTVDGVTYKVGDSIIHNGGDATASSGWDHVDNTESVTAVEGKVGDVTLNKGDVGLSNVTNDAQVKVSDLQANGGTVPETSRTNTFSANQEFEGNVEITGSGWAMFPNRTGLGTVPDLSGDTLQVSGGLAVQDGMKQLNSDGDITLAWYTSGSYNISIFRNYVNEPTVLSARANAGDPTTTDREATLALVRTDDNGNEEFVDYFNNGYNNSTDRDAVMHGIRVQKRGDGQFRDFGIQYDDGLTAEAINVMRVRASDQAVRFYTQVIGGDPTGGYQGAGTANFEGLYDQGGRVYSPNNQPTASDVGLSNVPNEDATNPANLNQAGAADEEVLAYSASGGWGPISPESIVSHNDVQGLQGGVTNERYHLSLTSYNRVDSLTANPLDKNELALNGGTIPQIARTNTFSANQEFEGNVEITGSGWAMFPNRTGLGTVPDLSGDTCQIVGGLAVADGLKQIDGSGNITTAWYTTGANLDNVVRNYQASSTVFSAKAQAGDPTADDSTAILSCFRTNDSGDDEFVEFFNRGVHSDDVVEHGIRVQKRGIGEYRDFALQYYDGSSGVEDVFRVFGADRSIKVSKTATFVGLDFSDEYANGTVSSNTTIDWKNGNSQNIQLAADITLSFSNIGIGHKQLRVVQDATGGRTPTLPAGKWPGGTVGSFSTAAGAEDILSVYYNGTDYYYQLTKGWS